MAKLKHAIKLHSGKVIPAGTELTFSNEGKAMYAGEQVDVYYIPTYAFEQAPALVNNQIDTEAQIKAFDALEPGDMGVDLEGKPARILGKAVGQKGFDDLYNQFGNTSAKSFEDITAGKTEDEIAAMQFVAYSNESGEVLIDLYGSEHVFVAPAEGAPANEAGKVCIKDFAEVNAADKAKTADGKVVTVLAKGQGKTWFKQNAEAFGLPEDGWDAIAEKFGDENHDDDAELILVKFEDGTMQIMCYCPENGAAVECEKEPEASVEAIMAAAKARWEKGGREAYARMQAQAACEAEICINEEDEDIRQNILTELDGAGISYEVEDGVIKVEDDDDNAEVLAKLAQSYPSVECGMAEAGIECHVSFTRK